MRRFAAEGLTTVHAYELVNSGSIVVSMRNDKWLSFAEHTRLNSRERYRSKPLCAILASRFRGDCPEMPRFGVCARFGALGQMAAALIAALRAPKTPRSEFRGVFRVVVGMAIM